MTKKDYWTTQLIQELALIYRGSVNSTVIFGVLEQRENTPGHLAVDILCLYDTAAVGRAEPGQGVLN